jgi:hypothetical protein
MGAKAFLCNSLWLGLSANVAGERNLFLWIKKYLLKLFLQAAEQIKKPLHFLKCNRCVIFIFLPFVYRSPLVADKAAAKIVA